MTTHPPARDAEVMAEINITPFTDVLLVLLIIFMILAALIDPPGFEKKLADRCEPRCAPASAAKLRPLDVLVARSGAIFVDGVRSDMRRIYGDLARAAKRRGLTTRVMLTADARAPYAVVMRILDAAQLAGFSDVGFVTS
jgi:biopolymer transport protein ExbD